MIWYLEIIQNPASRIKPRALTRVGTLGIWSPSAEVPGWDKEPISQAPGRGGTAACGGLARDEEMQSDESLIGNQRNQIPQDLDLHHSDYGATLVTAQFDGASLDDWDDVTTAVLRPIRAQ